MSNATIIRYSAHPTHTHPTHTHCHRLPINATPKHTIYPGNHSTLTSTSKCSKTQQNSTNSGTNAKHSKTTLITPQKTQHPNKINSSQNLSKNTPPITKKKRQKTIPRLRMLTIQANPTVAAESTIPVPQLCISTSGPNTKAMLPKEPSEDRDSEDSQLISKRLL